MMPKKNRKPLNLLRKRNARALCAIHKIQLAQPEEIADAKINSPTAHENATPDNSALARLEAILFVAREPLAEKKLAALAEISSRQVRGLIQKLNTFYDTVSRAFCVVEIAGGWQLRTRQQFATWLLRLQEVPVEVRLTQSCLETLTIIAYKQPVPRAEIEAIRGVQCGEMIRQLLDQDLILIAGRGDDLGRPFLYGTTKRFLQVFGLHSLDDLPVRKSR